MNDIQPRGFMAVVSTLIVGITLTTLAISISQEAFFLRQWILRAEYKAVAEAAAESCARSVLLRLILTPTETVHVPESIYLRGNKYCSIEHVEVLSDSYRITTSAEFKGSHSHRVLEADRVNSEIVNILSREI